MKGSERLLTVLSQLLTDELTAIRQCMANQTQYIQICCRQGIPMLACNGMGMLLLPKIGSTETQGIGG